MSMINESSSEINIGSQDVSVGSKVFYTYVNVDTMQLKKGLHFVGETNNLSDIKTKIQANIKCNKIYLFFKNQEGEQIEYQNDQQILQQLAMKKNKFTYRVLSQELRKVQSEEVKVKNKSEIILQSPKVEEQESIYPKKSCIVTSETKIQQHSNTASFQQQPTIKKQKSQLSIKKSKSKQLKKRVGQEKQVKISEGSQLVQNMQQVIDKILKAHIADIAQQLFPSSNDNPNTLFNLICTFCKKFQLRKRIFACQQNHQIVACQSCSQYLHYQLPLPFKIYTRPSEYEKARNEQPKQASSSFLEKFQQQKQRRNDAIMSKLNGLPTLSLKGGK